MTSPVERRYAIRKSAALVTARSREIMICALLLFVVAPSRAQEVVIKGQVLDANAVPIPNAVLKVPTLGAEATVSVSGRFSLSIKGVRLDNVFASISAPGFKSETRNIPIVDGVGNAGQIMLTPAPSVTVASVSRALSEDRSHWVLDADITNELAEKVRVSSSFIVGSTKTDRKDCLDASPGVVYDVGDIDKDNNFSVRLTAPKDKYSTSIVATGHVDFLPCSEIHLDLRIPSSFVLDPHEKTKIEFRLPLILKKTAEDDGKVINLAGWQSLTVGFEIEGGIRAQYSVH